VICLISAKNDYEYDDSTTNTVPSVNSNSITATAATMLCLVTVLQRTAEGSICIVT